MSYMKHKVSLPDSIEDLSDGDGGDVTLGATSLKGHIIPTANAQYDLGNAEYKIRHLFLSDNSLWVGQDHKISVEDGSFNLKKRKGTQPSNLVNVMSSYLNAYVDAFTYGKVPSVISFPAHSGGTLDFDVNEITSGAKTSLAMAQDILTALDDDDEFFDSNSSSSWDALVIGLNNGFIPIPDYVWSDSMHYHEQSPGGSLKFSDMVASNAHYTEADFDSELKTSNRQIIEIEKESGFQSVLMSMPQTGVNGFVAKISIHAFIEDGSYTFGEYLVGGQFGVPFGNPTFLYWDQQGAYKSSGPTPDLFNTVVASDDGGINHKITVDFPSIGTVIKATCTVELVSVTH